MQYRARTWVRKSVRLEILTYVRIRAYVRTYLARCFEPKATDDEKEDDAEERREQQEAGEKDGRRKRTSTTMRKRTKMIDELKR